MLGIVVLAVVTYLFRNGRKNSDPFNRKAAAEICEYLTSTGAPDIIHIASILMSNARYRKDARHIASMVPTLLVGGGMSVRDAKLVHKPLLHAADLVPE